MLAGISSTLKFYRVEKCCFLHLLNLILLMLSASIPVAQNTCCKKSKAKSVDNHVRDNTRFTI